MKSCLVFLLKELLVQHSLELRLSWVENADDLSLVLNYHDG
ncbi:MAG TPA: hypothetical protein V6C95_00310 [Coleofasciculaceae cyanobacterium]